MKLARRLSPSPPLAAVIVTVVAVAAMTGCGGSSSGDSEQSAPAPRQAAFKQIGKGTEVLAVQGGSEASLRRDGEGTNYELVVEKPDPRTVYFDVSPARGAQTAAVAKLPGWVQRENVKPNLNLSWYAGEESGSLVAELLGIEYEKPAGALRATLAPLSLPGGAPAVTGTASLGQEPFSDASVNIVFDDSENMRCFAQMFFAGEAAVGFWDLKSSSAEHDDWAPGYPDQQVSDESLIGSETSSPFLGCEFSATYVDGSGNSFTVGVDNPLIGSPSYTCTGSSSVICHSETSESGSGNEAFMQANISYR